MNELKKIVVRNIAIKLSGISGEALSQPAAAIANYKGSKHQRGADECGHRSRRADDRTRRFREQRLGAGASSGPIEALLRHCDLIYPRSLRIYLRYVARLRRCAGDASREWNWVKIPIQFCTNRNQHRAAYYR